MFDWILFALRLESKVYLWSMYVENAIVNMYSKLIDIFGERTNTGMYCGNSIVARFALNRFHEHHRRFEKYFARLTELFKLREVRVEELKR